MHLFNIMLVAATAALMSPTLACKCKSGSYNAVDATRSCCGFAGGSFYLDDCTYTTLPSGGTNSFKDCCGRQSYASDC
ncbi:hypothetical protein B0T25DRAFT_540574 [Lasiosphaeria hispida]|uniref:Uncharacterized protein n=1 Tax=Lasiosphaeria hispida TaxID=260671 RepID=A0AAJ0HN37_9PEZI|nr:hypothetical protein B0T25DRAFT_540574 [Lasiosphaeria hispida]